jgi:phosphatidate cytidylyltransferase
VSSGRAPQRTARDERLLREERRARVQERERRQQADAQAQAAARAAELAEREDRKPQRRPDAERPERGARGGRVQARERADRAASPARRRGGSELLSRILIAVPLAIVAIIFVDVGGLAWALLMAAVSVLCLIELYRMLDRWSPVPLIGYGFAVAMTLAARYGTDRNVLELAMAAIPVTFLAVVGVGGGRLATVSIAGTLLGIFWIGLGFAHATLLRQLPHGNGIAIDVMVGTFLADIGAYFGGRAFGRRPLAPAISPNKTVEGLSLGMFTAIVAVFVAGRFQQTWLTEGDSLLLGLTVAVLGPIGDLFESLVKRDAGTKDAGTLFGAHGGALDRLDAVVFTAVGAYYVWAALAH